MSKNNNPSWNTKYGRRRVRNDAPTIEEAIEAAQGLTDAPGAQAEIAASLSGVSLDQVRAAMAKMVAPRKDATRTFTFAGPTSAPRTVVVERKPSRRVIAADRSARPWTAGRGMSMPSPR
jgi:hypothetical protein